VAAARFIMSRPELGPRWQADKDAIWVMRQTGHEVEAAEYAQKLLSRWPPDLFLRGFVLGALGRFDDALPLLARTTVLSTQWLFWDPMWDQYRADPRFAVLIAQLKCNQEYEVARAALARMLGARGSTT
jgi:hypothetical protein